MSVCLPAPPELADHTAQTAVPVLRPCVCLQGTCSEECQRIEGFFDTARVRIEKLSARLEAADRRFTAERLPWERAVFRNARSATLNLAIIYMYMYAFQAFFHLRGSCYQPPPSTWPSFTFPAWLMRLLLAKLRRLVLGHSIVGQLLRH